MAKAAILDTSVQRTHEWLHEIGAELPTFIRGVCYESWHPSAAMPKAPHKTDF